MFQMQKTCYLNQCLMANWMNVKVVRRNQWQNNIRACGRTITPASENASDGLLFHVLRRCFVLFWLRPGSMLHASLCTYLGFLIALLFWPDLSSMFVVCFLVFWGLRLIMHSNMISFIIVLALCKSHALSFACLFVILFCLVSSPRDWPCAQMSFNLV